MFCSVSEKRGTHEFAYFSIGGLPTKSGSTASAASQYSLRDLQLNMLPHKFGCPRMRGKREAIPR
jgi:hypothetical protein